MPDEIMFFSVAFKNLLAIILKTFYLHKIKDRAGKAKR